MKNINNTKIIKEINTGEEVTFRNRIFYDELFFLKTDIENYELIILLRPKDRLRHLASFDNSSETNSTNSAQLVKPIPYIISSLITGGLTLTFAFIIYNAYSKNVFLLDPFVALFGCLASFGLFITSIIGIIVWEKDYEKIS